MKAKEAKDIMEPVKGYLSPEHTFIYALDLMENTERFDGTGIGVRSMIVLDHEDNLVGTLSVSDIYNAMIPSYMTGPLSVLTYRGMLGEMIRESAPKKIAEIMNKPVTVKEDSSDEECVVKMGLYRLSILPVVNKEKKVVGIIYNRDMDKAIRPIIKEIMKKNGIEEGGA